MLKISFLFESMSYPSVIVVVNNNKSQGKIIDSKHKSKSRLQDCYISEQAEVFCLIYCSIAVVPERFPPICAFAPKTVVLWLLSTEPWYSSLEPPI